MTIDSQQDYDQFFKDNGDSDVILDCIGKDDRYHPAADTACLLLVKNIKTYKYYSFFINHPDGIYHIDKNKLINDFNNLNVKKWVFDKKKFIQLLNINNLLDYNLIEYLETGEIKEYSEYDSVAHVFLRQSLSMYSDINYVIPLSIHNEKFDKMTDSVANKLQSVKLDPCFTKLNTSTIENLTILESNGLKVDVQLFNQFFGEKKLKIKNDFVYTQYNLFTSTGRPSNRFGGINYAALKKDNGCRSCFISRYGKQGKLFMIDYTAYHPHLIAELVNYQLPDNTYEYLGKYYFNKTELTDEEIKAAKNLTFQLMYGNVKDEYKNIPYFVKIQNYITNRWDYFKTYGYIETPIYKRQITSNNIQEPNSTKLFNYILQASETEYNMEMLTLVNTYLQMYNKLTKPILYTYDSVLFDMYANDGIDTLKQIKKLMAAGGRFPVKCYVGDNYNEMSVISI
jgi:hypothetical protein